MAVEAPNHIEMPWRVESKIPGQAIEKLTEALLNNPEAKEELARDSIDPKSVSEFSINGISHRLSIRHQDFGTNSRQVYLMFSSGENGINLSAKYQLNRDGSKTYIGSGESTLIKDDKKFYGENVSDLIESSFPAIFPQEK